MDDNLKSKIIKVLESETKVLLSGIDYNAPVREQISIDSMQFITVIARLEDVLNVSIPTSIMGISTLNEFFSELEKVVDK